MKTLQSQQDSSVNFITEAEQGFYESRYVRRSPTYFCCYLSVQSACNRGCRFCHLTTSKQTVGIDASISDLLSQADQVIAHYKTQPKAEFVNVNFMARGEALASRVLLEYSPELLTALYAKFKAVGLNVKFNVSTIMPKTLKTILVDIFPIVYPTLYYSLYSTKEDFRQKWMPGAMSYENAFDRLREYQYFSKKIVKIHHALIAGENDSAEDAHNVATALKASGLVCEAQIVAYNPPDGLSSAPSDAVVDTYCYLLQVRGVKVKKVARVGFDVYASCGMFYPGETNV